MSVTCSGKTERTALYSKVSVVCLEITERERQRERERESLCVRKYLCLFPYNWGNVRGCERGCSLSRHDWKESVYLVCTKVFVVCSDLTETFGVHVRKYHCFLPISETEKYQICITSDRVYVPYICQHAMWVIVGDPGFCYCDHGTSFRALVMSLGYGLSFVIQTAL